jgi:TPR repeat protein
VKRRFASSIIVGALALAAPAPVLAQQEGDCAQGRNVLESQLAMPSDFSLNMVDTGSIFIVSPDGCAGPVYAVQFPRQLEAAERGDAEAMDQVGLMYAAGAGTGQDWQRARSWLERAASAGSAKARYRLGVMAQYGLGRTKDLPAALAHYAAASEGGVAWASTNLGTLHLAGEGVPRSVEAAVRYFELARVQGDPTASQNLASMHAQGLISGRPDFAKAVPLAREAAIAGDVGGMRIYAYLLARGDGVAADPETAYLWARLAAERGDAVSGTLKDRLGGTIGPEAVARADRRLALCPEDARERCLAGQQP